MAIVTNAVRDLVADALSNLYDPVHLRTHDLLHELLIQPLPGESPGEALRRVLREAIEALRPPEAVPHGRREWLQYRVLTYHYVRCLTPEETCQELSLSRSSFYRRRREGLDALVCELLERPESAVAGPVTLKEPQADEPDDLGRAQSLLASLPRETFDVVELTHRAEGTVKPLAEKRRVAILSGVTSVAQKGYGTVAAIRQVLVGALAECLEWLEDDRLEVCLGERSTEALWRLHVTAHPERLAQVLLESEGSFWRRLLAACEGRIWVCETASGGPAMHLALPVFRRQPTILIIDDDARACALYARYLESAGYNTRSARTVAEAQEHLARAMPDLVLLDVILPQEDGWTILAQIRRDVSEAVPPSRMAADVPVVVCSVMEQTELALALGADAVLGKPIGPEELLVTVHRFLPTGGRPAKASPKLPAGV